MSKGSITYKDPLSIERALAAAAAYSTLEEAVEHLKTAGITTTVRQLENWTVSKRERYEEIRAELAPFLEKHLANDLRDVAHLSVEIDRLSLEGLHAELNKNAGFMKASDLARISRDVMQVASQATEKLMTYEGRPEKITEHRSIGELADGLVRLKVATYVDSTATEIEEAK